MQFLMPFIYTCSSCFQIYLSPYACLPSALELELSPIGMTSLRSGLGTIDERQTRTSRVRLSTSSSREGYRLSSAHIWNSRLTSALFLLKFQLCNSFWCTFPFIFLLLRSLSLTVLNPPYISNTFPFFGFTCLLMLIRLQSLCQNYRFFDGY